MFHCDALSRFVLETYKLKYRLRVLENILILKKASYKDPLYTEKTFCIERVTPQLTFFFFLILLVFGKLFVLEYS